MPWLRPLRIRNPLSYNSSYILKQDWIYSYKQYFKSEFILLQPYNVYTVQRSDTMSITSIKITLLFFWGGRGGNLSWSTIALLSWHILGTIRKIVKSSLKWHHNCYDYISHGSAMHTKWRVMSKLKTKWLKFCYYFMP